MSPRDWKDGSLHGYAGGLERKCWLLQHENQLNNQNIFSMGVRITAFELRIWIVIKRFRKIYKIIIQSIHLIQY